MRGQCKECGEIRDNVGGGDREGGDNVRGGEEGIKGTK
jgi:hypothetical protein